MNRSILVGVLATFPAALPIALLAVSAPVWLVAVAMFGWGIAADVFAVLWSTTIQRELPEEALSRVSSYDLFGSLAFAPLGLLVAGPVAGLVGTREALAGCAAMIVVATCAALLSPQVRRLTPAAHPSPTQPGADTSPVAASPTTDEEPA